MSGEEGKGEELSRVEGGRIVNVLYKMNLFSIKNTNKTQQENRIFSKNVFKINGVARKRSEIYEVLAFI